MHAGFSQETCPTQRKMRPFTTFWRQTEHYFAIVGDISTFKRHFLRILHAECYACRFSLESSPTVRKMRPYTRIWKKLSVISLLLEIFRRLIAISIAFYTPNAMHAVFSVDTIPTVRNMRPYTRFWRKLTVISILLAIFRRLNAISIAFYAPNAMHAVFSVESSPTVPKMRPFTRFWRKLCIISILL